MSYTKPEVVELANAVKAIQGGLPKNYINADSPVNNASVNAYEADE